VRAVLEELAERRELDRQYVTAAWERRPFGKWTTSYVPMHVHVSSSTRTPGRGQAARGRGIVRNSGD
jgi:hypothetical protein